MLRRADVARFGGIERLAMGLDPIASISAGQHFSTKKAEVLTG
jgi:hypothetical protein